MIEPGQTQMVPIGQIRPNPWNPNVVPEHVMEALVANVKRVGMNQPILVRPLTDGEFEIVDGEHRWQVANRAGLEEVPVIVRDLDDHEAKAQTLAMNKLRGEMEPADVARIFRELSEDGLPYEELATFTGYTLPEIENYDALLPDPEEGLLPALGGEDDDSGQGRKILRLAWAANEAPLSESEASALTARFQEWKDATGSTFGFVAALLELEAE